MNAVTVQIERLRRAGCEPATPAELDAIEQRSGLTLPAPFRQFWSAVGGCGLSARIAAGPAAGSRVMAFWPASRILQELDEGGHGAGMVPFADDPFGNWYFLHATPAGTVVDIVDWDTDQMSRVSPSFEQLVTDLVM